MIKVYLNGIEIKAGFDPGQPRDPDGQWTDGGDVFPDSKVRDENGKLKTVYHGTKYNFDQFSYEKIGVDGDFGQLGKGFYFTDEFDNAMNYANNSFGPDDPIVKEVYLNIQNPYKWEKQIDSLNMITENQARSITEKLIKKGYDGIQYKTDWGQTWFVVFDSKQIKIIK